MEHELTREDINSLMEAVEDWEQSVAVNFVFHGLSMSLHADKGSPDAMAALEKKLEKKFSSMKAQSAHRKEYSILLRAKLLLLRAELDRREIIKMAQDGV